MLLLNFLPVAREEFLLAVPDAGIYEEVFNTDAEEFGGGGCVNAGEYRTEPCMLRGYSRAIRIKIPPMSGLVFRCKRKFPKRKPKN